MQSCHLATLGETGIRHFVDILKFGNSFFGVFFAAPFSPIPQNLNQLVVGKKQLGEFFYHVANCKTCFTLLTVSMGQGCQMVYFQTQNPNFGKFWRALEWKRLVNSSAIRNIL
jgi:hypothetical protein